MNRPCRLEFRDQRSNFGDQRSDYTTDHLEGATVLLVGRCGGKEDGRGRDGGGGGLKYLK